jgi:hypothetical protein
MAAPDQHSASVELMAFQVVLQRLQTLEEAFAAQERALRSMPPLLKKIIDHLEAQATPPALDVATYGQLYHELQDVHDEDDEDDAPPPSIPAVPARRRLWWRWFLKEGR